MIFDPIRVFDSQTGWGTVDVAQPYFAPEDKICVDWDSGGFGWYTASRLTYSDLTALLKFCATNRAIERQCHETHRH